MTQRRVREAVKLMNKLSARSGSDLSAYARHHRMQTRDGRFGRHSIRRCGTHRIAAMATGNLVGRLDRPHLSPRKELKHA